MNGQRSILGVPLIFSEKLPALGSANDFNLCDFSAYSIGVRQAASIQLSAHAGFELDEVLLRVTARYDGQPSLADPRGSD